MSTLEQLYAEWQRETGPRARDCLVARALGGSILEGDSLLRVQWKHHGIQILPHYCSNLQDAQAAMDQAWSLMEEEAPVRVHCSLEQSAETGRRHCTVTWWLNDEIHCVTPCFDSEAESRAFAAFAFSRQEADVNC